MARRCRRQSAKAKSGTRHQVIPPSSRCHFKNLKFSKDLTQSQGEKTPNFVCVFMSGGSKSAIFSRKLSTKFVSPVRITADPDWQSSGEVVTANYSD